MHPMMEMTPNSSVAMVKAVDFLSQVQTLLHLFRSKQPGSLVNPQTLSVSQSQLYKSVLQK